MPAALEREPTEAEGWLARTQAAFPEQPVGRRFAVRGTHVAGAGAAGRVALTLDAGLAFGSGEHGSHARLPAGAGDVARRTPPARVLDLGTGSGILAMAAAPLLRRPVLATDIEPWSVRVAAAERGANGVARLVRPRWRWLARRRARGRPFDLVFANILARPLCRMARDLAAHLAPGGTVILAGLLASQVRDGARGAPAAGAGAGRRPVRRAMGHAGAAPAGVSGPPAAAKPPAGWRWCGGAPARG